MRAISVRGRKEERKNMGVYSVLVPDSKILKGVAGFRSVVVLGCPVCANLSIAYDKNLPVSRIVVNEDTGETTRPPVAIAEEANRLKDLLESKGMSVRIEMWPMLCTISAYAEQAESEFINRCAEVEAIIALCCAGGALGIKRRLAKAVKIMPGMKTAGESQYCIVLDEAKEFVYIDKKKSTVIRMFKE